MDIGLVLFALLVAIVTLKRGWHGRDSYREFPHTDLYSRDKSDSANLYGRHTENHLYPNQGDDTPMHTDHRSKAS